MAARGRTLGRWPYRGRHGGSAISRSPSVASPGSCPALNEAYREASRPNSLRSYRTLARPRLPRRSKSKSLISCVTRPYHTGGNGTMAASSSAFLYMASPHFSRSLLSLPLHRPHHPSPTDGGVLFLQTLVLRPFVDDLVTHNLYGLGHLTII